jgi:hypothetical protein
VRLSWHTILLDARSGSPTEVGAVAGKKRATLAGATFTDGAVKEIDLSELAGGGVFARIYEQREIFEQVAVNPESGAVEWPGKVDLDPKFSMAATTGAPDAPNPQSRRHAIRSSAGPFESLWRPREMRASYRARVHAQAEATEGARAPSGAPSPYAARIAACTSRPMGITCSSSTARI